VPFIKPNAFPPPRILHPKLKKLEMSPYKQKLPGASVGTPTPKRSKSTLLYGEDEGTVGYRKCIIRFDNSPVTLHETENFALDTKMDEKPPVRKE